MTTTWLLLAASMLGVADAPPPNVVVIIADDLGWADLGCTGSTFYETPNLDRLAREGAQFTQAYAACPVCSPSRAALVTGKYPQRVGITDFIGGRRAGKLLPAPNRNRLDLDERTVAESFRAAGYATGFFGKWHLGGPGFQPEDQGFDLNRGGGPRGAPATYFAPYKIQGLPEGPDGEYLTDRLAAEAVSFIEANADRPFLVWMPQYAVHVPLQAKAEMIARYEAKARDLPASDAARFRPEGTKQDRRVQDHPVYAAMMQSLDEAVGQVLDTLDRLGLADRTIVVFTSDNGGLSTAEGSPTSNAPLRAGKGWMYEGGTRVPLLIRQPGVIAAGRVVAAPTIGMDLFPTLLDLSGLPAEPAHHLDGQSLGPLLRGEVSAASRDLFWHYPHYANQGSRPFGAVRSGDWKLIERYEDDGVELFDLGLDPIEERDLAAEQPGRVAELREKLRLWRESVGAVMPRPNPDYKEGGEPSIPPARATE